MTLSFLPGVPNSTPQATCQRSWNNNVILAYCSGNNLILLSNRSERLQTIYLNSDCHAVDVNPRNGLIAVAVSQEVLIYKPLHQIMKNPKWVFCAKVYHDDSQVNTLQWGMDNELVLGSDYLSFWDIKDVFGEYKPRLLWSKRQPLPVYVCSITSDSKLISSMNYNDKTVKIWRRVSITSDSDFFDLIILPHPDVVTGFRWKTSDHQCDKEHITHVIYTLCSDKKLRVWISFDMDNNKNVQHWGTVEMLASENERFCVILDSWLVQKALEQTAKELSPLSALINYILEKKPEILLFSTPSHGIRMIALTNLSDDIPKIMSVKDLLKTHISTPAIGSSPEFVYFPEPQIFDDGKSISFVVHDLHGCVRHSLLNISSILNGKEKVGTMQHKWTGHTKSIQKLFRSSDGSALLTTSRFQENSIWVPLQLKNSVTLSKKAMLITESPIKHALIHDKGNMVITLLESCKIQLWICNSNEKKAFLKTSFTVDESRGFPCLMVNTSGKEPRHNERYFAYVYPDGSSQGFLFTRDGMEKVSSNSIDLEGEEHFYLTSAIDPVRYQFQSDRSLVAVITKNGIIRIYKADVDQLGIRWKKSYETVTNIKNASKITGSSNDKICVIDDKGTTMTLWDLRRSVLEYETTFEERVVDIDWTSTEFEQSIVAIGFENYVILFTQLRYDYTNKNPAYLPIEKINVSEHTTHAIGDSTWLNNGSIIIATGNQVFIKDKSLDLKDKFTYNSIGSRKILSNDILHLTSVLNGPLPVYHPQLLIQSLFAKRINLVREILLKLFHALRKMEFTADEVHNIGSSLRMDPSKFLHSNDITYEFDKYEEPYSSFDLTVSVALIELLSKTPLPYLTRHQQVTLISVIEAVEEINLNQKAVDINGVRFMLGVKLYTSHKSSQSGVNMRDVSWATHSDNKEILYSNISGRLRKWDNVRELKVAYWAEQQDLVKCFESIAKLEFNNNDNKDPSRCSIFYLSLKKRNILIGLWRISSGHPEQAKMLKFLNNDFTESRWRSAALKNAFVLLSKHRYVDAASFFLLAGSLKDCINVIRKQINDLDLAVAVCRVYEGDNGSVLDEFLREQILPKAIIDSDRWTTSYVYWKMRKQDLAIKALVQPPVELDDNSKWIQKNKCVNKSFLVEDPLLLQLYLQLRNRNIDYYNAALEVNESLEYEIVMRVVTIYTRMGCDYLAVALLNDWKFMESKKVLSITEEIPESSHAKSTVNKIEEPVTTQKVRPSLFDRFDSQSSESPKFHSSPAGESNNILDSFFPDDNSSNGHLRKISQPSFNILDSYRTGNSDDFSSKKSNIMYDSTDISENAAQKSQSARHLSILEENRANEEKLIVSKTAPTKQQTSAGTKPKSLLDDFM
ncbi:unnamed protein product [Kluyveromyces dobzhanskii CBS 2104]|uniref:WGS project CCBQ000000000 data, contig 00006 n=1 Tax=Kluyveromyces dobzhanskii CBS 2104 TaxID=1427455 RepID=A0A0A8L7S7_9SACH|nr:unnamed protein product [Kluyveromyces dobzhanskii CBS 2104]